VMELVVSQLFGGVHPASSASSASDVAGVSSNASAVGGALGDVPGFLSYLWQVFLPRLGFMAPHFTSSVYPAYSIFVIRGWAAFGSYTATFPSWVYWVITAAMLSVIPLGAVAARMERGWVRAHLPELIALVAMPVAVVVGFEAAYYTPGIRPVIAEVGRYAFPAIGPLALLALGALHAFGRRLMVDVAAGVIVALIGLSFASQLLALTSYYA
jgi:hypothetical protein